MTFREDDVIEPRDTWRAIRRGLCLRCPNCGSGKLLYKYLSVHNRCPQCQEDFHHHRADDGPAYLTILIVGHILAPLMLAIFVAYRPSPWTMIALFGSSSVVLSLALLPMMKGAIISVQWAARMHGFGADRTDHD
ncbi:hypothetical protein BFP70_11020 [Thioclava sp. SK-1]|uniref:DUF983 domain-containing protein n=1 Tax=Thioclava sp. SK-1 TaxID=1889770 RepID=UPI000823FDBD|nr:DUF983 domain-containing protein [Thioclava sp. SK-1]OCX64559.1 hypothetical protein BFP70_11020 [Thioclava sp. SK-1]